MGVNKIASLFGGRLLTQKEWEIIASCNGKYLYPWGNENPSISLANYGNNIGSTTQIGLYQPAKCGLYDLSGNVGAWCESEINGFEKPVKGGAWNKTEYYLKNTNYYKKWTQIGSVSVGFRITF